MDNASLHRTVARLHTLARAAADATATDAALLQRFADNKDERAFAELVHRHGALVQNVARRLLGDHHAAEDVVQITFLLLARKAGCIHWKPSISSWLHAAAFRLACETRKRSKRLPVASGDLPVDTAAKDSQASLLWKDARAAIDEELQELPDSLRAPIVLCYLQGLTRDEAAQRIGWTVATLKRRLERGRELLRVRLTRRGLALSACLSVLLANETVLSAEVLEGIILHVRGGLDDGAIGSIFAINAISRWRTWVAVALMLSAVTGSAWVMLARSEPEKPAPAPLLGPEESSPAHADVSGDSLPNGAVRRLGTTRFRPGKMIQGVAFSPDSKKLAVWARSWMGNSGDSLIFYEASTGRELQVIPLPPSALLAMRWLIDGRGLAVIKIAQGDYFLWEFTNPNATIPKNPRGDVSSWKYGDIRGAAISPDGRWVITGRSSGDGKDQPLELWPAKPNRRFADFKLRLLDNQGGHGMHFLFAPDSKTVFSLSRRREPAENRGAVIPGKPAERSVLLVHDIATGSQLSSFNVFAPPEHLEGAVLAPTQRMELDPDGETVWVGDEAGMIRAYDWQTGQENKSFRAHPAGNSDRFEQPGVYSLMFGPDGRSLFSSGQYGGIVIRDTKTGSLRSTIDRSKAKFGHYLAFSPDRKWLAAADTGSVGEVHVFDANSGQSTLSLPGHSSMITTLRVIDNATAITGGIDNTLRWWDIETGREIKRRRLEIPRFLLGGAAISATGRSLFIVKERRLSHVDLASSEATFIDKAEEKGRLFIHCTRGDSVYFSPGDGSIKRWSKSSGKVTQAIPRSATAEKSELTGRLHVSPDGMNFALLSSSWTTSGNIGYFSGSRVTLGELKSGKIRKSWHTKEANFECAQFSSDGRFLVVGCSTRSAGSASKGDADELTVSARTGVLLFDVASGDPVCAFEPGAGSRSGICRVPTVAISADGYFVAAVQHDNSIAVYELASGNRCRLLRGHNGEVPDLSFTPNGRRLVSASYDMTGLVWDTSFEALAKPRPLPSETELERAWADLAKPDWERAGPAMASLAKASDKLISLVRSRIPRTDKPDIDAKAVGKLVEQLNDPVYAVRNRASAALARYGREALPLLRKFLGKFSSREQRKRLQMIIEQIGRSPVPSDYLRNRRALALLEQACTTAAQTELKRLSTGHPDTMLTRDAKSAVERGPGQR